MAELNIAQPMRFKVDVKTGLVEQPQREALMKGDKKANRIIVELVDGSEPVDITGVAVKGKFCRPPDLDEISLVGEAEGNLALVQLTDACYTASGNYKATVSLVLDDVERTVLYISGSVLQSGSGSAASDDGDGGSTGSGLPSGGTAGQVLVKVSAAEGAAIWKTLTAADIGAQPAGDYALKSEIPTTASDVGALPADGKAKSAENADNATALNGKPASDYALKVNTVMQPDYSTITVVAALTLTQDLINAGDQTIEYTAPEDGWTIGLVTANGSTTNNFFVRLLINGRGMTELQGIQSTMPSATLMIGPIPVQGGDVIVLACNNYGATIGIGQIRFMRNLVEGINDVYLS